MKKRIIASILTFIMLMTMLPTAAFAADGESTETGGSTTPEAAIYLDQQHGADDKDGLSKTTAVKTIEKANELANEKNIKDICLSSFYQVTGTETWDLGGKTLHRYNLGGYMIELVGASASLTLSNVVIDGAEYSVDATHAAETDSIIKAANGGTIVLNSGAILQNNKAAQFGSGILANNGVKITMEDGAIIRNNTNSNYELGGGILIGNSSTFTMNGGEISGNTANGGGGVAIIGSTMVMNDGVKMFDDTPKEVFRHYKELEAIGLAAPQITYVVQGLRERGKQVKADTDKQQEHDCLESPHDKFKWYA